MEDVKRFTRLNAAQIQELSKHLTMEERIAFFNDCEFDEFCEATASLEPEPFAMAAKVFACDAIEIDNSIKMDEEDTSFYTITKTPCVSLGVGGGLIAAINYGNNLDIKAAIGLAGFLTAYGISRLAVLVIGEITKRREPTANLPVDAAKQSQSPAPSP